MELRGKVYTMSVMGRLIARLTWSALIAVLALLGATEGRAYYHEKRAGDFTARRATEEELAKALIPSESELRKIEACKQTACRGLNPVRRVDMSVRFEFD